MSAPPGFSPTSEHAAEVRAPKLMRDAMSLLAACGITRSPAWVSRTVRNWHRQHALPFGQYLLEAVQANDAQRRAVAEDSSLVYCLTYWDPTGEAAMRNVLRERGF